MFGLKQLHQFLQQIRVPKLAFEECEIGSKKIKICAIAKGSGMIAPNLCDYHATMVGILYSLMQIFHHLF